MINLTNCRISRYNRLDFFLKPMAENLTGSADRSDRINARGRLRRLAAAAGMAVAGVSTEAVATTPDRTLMTAIEDAISANPQIKGVCQGIAMAGMQATPGSFSLAYPVAKDASEDELKGAIQDCLDWDYAKGDDPTEQNVTIVPLEVTAVERTDSGLQVTVMPARTGEAVIRETRASLLGQVFGATAAHAALPERDEIEPQTDHLTALVGPKEAEHIRAALSECMAEVAEIIEELDDPEEQEEFRVEFEADCAADQQHGIKMALIDQQIAAENTKQAELRAEGAILDKTLAALEIVNGQITDTLLDAALCEITKKPDDVCAAIDRKLEAISGQARAIAKRLHSRPKGDKISSLVTPKS